MGLQRVHLAMEGWRVVPRFCAIFPGEKDINRFQFGCTACSTPLFEKKGFCRFVVSQMHRNNGLGEARLPTGFAQPIFAFKLFAARFAGCKCGAAAAPEGRA